MSKSVAAGLSCLGIIALGLAVSRGQDAGKPPAARNAAPARSAAVEQTKAAVKLAELDVEVQNLQNACDVGAAEARYELAILDLRKYTDGELVHETNVLKFALKLAVEEELRATETFASVQESAKKGTASQQDVESARVARVKTEVERALAAEELHLLETFQSPRQIAELKSEVRQSELELALVKARAEAALLRAKAELAAANRSLDLATEAAAAGGAP